jgi:heme/copper-type cytochrome/quinol oxidase subunit 1
MLVQYVFEIFYLVTIGLAGVGGMLRRMLYVNGLGPFQPYMNAAVIGAVILAAAYGSFC